jgi:hypothetical protein
MRPSTFILAAAFTVAAAAVAPAEEAPPPLAPPMPYKTIAVTLPKQINDRSLDAFRQQIIAVAQKKDRTALAGMVARTFFWMPDDKDIADKKKPAIDNLAKAIGLDGADATGWETLGLFANETTADPPDPQRKGVVCTPGQPEFDEKAATDVITATKTDPSEWGYPGHAGVEVRSGPDATAAVTEKLGLHLVRAYPDESPEAAVHGEVLRIVTPSGKLAYMPADQLLPLTSDQICYVKEGNAWKIGGIIGGTEPGR